jgi:hypothetical protein
MGLPGNRNQQLEALTFVPDLADPEGGLFYAGRQNDGKIFVFRLPIVSSVTATDVEFVTTITPEVGLADISGLYYHQANGLLYGIFDSSNLLVAMNTDGTTVMQRDLDGNNQEGFTIGENGEVFVSEDHGEVWRYMFADIPLADAGEDETVTDSNGDGTYAYALDGSGSTSMSSISSYTWYEGVTQLATGVSTIVDLAVGVHTITLIVMNEQTVTDDDTLEITVLPASNDCNGDLDDDGDVDGSDAAHFADAFGSSSGDPNYNPAADIDGDGDVNESDLAEFALHYGEVCPQGVVMVD